MVNYSQQYETKTLVTKNELMYELNNIKQDPKYSCVEHLHKVVIIKD